MRMRVTLEQGFSILGSQRHVGHLECLHIIKKNTETILNELLLFIKIMIKNNTHQQLCSFTFMDIT